MDSIYHRLKKLLDRILTDTLPLVEAPTTHDNAFLNVLLAIYRISYFTLRDIYYLTSHEQTGSSALDLARKIIEHGVTIEYMIMKDKEKMAKRFQDYLWVQAHEEMEFLKSIGQNPADLSDELKLGAEKSEKKYRSLSQNIKNHRTWAGRSVDGMLEDLYSNKAMNNFDYSRLAQAYIWGSRLNHPNPFVVRNYLAEDVQTAADEFYLCQAVFMAITFHLRLTTRYIDEVRVLNKQNLYQELVDKINDFYRELDNL